MSKVTSIRMSEEIAARLDQLATSLDRPKSWLIEQAIARYIEEESWQVAAITEALTQYREGEAKLIPHSDVMREIESIIRQRTGDEGSLA